MDRKEFFKKSAALAFVAAGGAIFLEACQKSNSSPATSSAPTVDFTIDISKSPYTALQTNGNYLYDNNIIIARDNGGNFIALYDVCTHAGCTIQFNGTSQFPCPCHGSVFNSSGGVVNGPATTGVKKYNTSLAGTMLRIYG
jgi:cytochrome b6-f complex iron-sulfur subunit